MQARQAVHKLGESSCRQLRAVPSRKLAARAFQQTRGNASQAVVPGALKQDTKLAQIIKGDIRVGHKPSHIY